MVVNGTPSGGAARRLEVGEVGEVGEVDPVTDLNHRRRRAVSTAVEQAVRATRGVWAADEPGSWGPGVGVCRYGPGCVVVALAGRSDRAGLESVRTLVDELHRLAATELVIDLSRLQDCEPSLARLLGRLRVQRLAAGARVQLQGPPREALAELGEHATAGHLDTSAMTSWSTSPGSPGVGDVPSDG